MTTRSGFVVSTTRRQAIVAVDTEYVDATVRNSVEEIVVGDLVSLEENQGSWFITEQPHRKNELSRALGEKKKVLAANLDMLYAVSAVEPPFNAVFIDRVLSTAGYEEIPVTLLYHKIDLNHEKDASILEAYETIGYEILQTTLRKENGMRSLEERVLNSSAQISALCGISGVGKSSIINALIPDTQARTGDLSRKTTQGKQTTSMAEAHELRRPGQESIYLIDLPGLQNYGISHIPLESLPFTFKEFASRAPECKFSDCTHTNEPQCAVTEALRAGQIAQFRYNNYISMREEIIRGKPF